MNVARLNFSHGDHNQHKQAIDWIRKASQSLKKNVGIMGDLQGPKIRIGKVVTELCLHKSKNYFFTSSSNYKNIAANGSKEAPFYVNYKSLLDDVKLGELILLDDGKVKFEIITRDASSQLMEGKLIYGDELSSNKGLNLPATVLKIPGITEKDWSDILFGIENELDFFALSFVRTHQEIKNLKKLLQERNSPIQVIAKIEKPEAIKNIQQILKESDGIMIARGDLGVEMGNEKVPRYQKMLIRKARERGKTVVTATQMLMSMTHSPSPSRAEASDVANAVYDGSDALMLSNETATGNYPVESLLTMDRIIRFAEEPDPANRRRRNWMNLVLEQDKVMVSEAIESAAVILGTALSAKALSCLTRSGQSARYLSKGRPNMPIFAFAENPRVRQQLSLVWGVTVFPWQEIRDQSYSIFDDLVSELGRLKLLQYNDCVILTAGIPTTQKKGSTNTVVVKHYEES